MNLTADMSVLAYAQSLSRESNWPVVFDDTVRPGLVVIDPKKSELAVHPNAHSYTLRQNAGQILPSNAVKR